MKLPYSSLDPVSFPSPYIGYNIAVFQTVGNYLSLILFNNFAKILIPSSLVTIIFPGLCHYTINSCFFIINPLKPELNPICYLLALLAHHFLHVSRIRVKSLTLRSLTLYIYMEHLFLMFLDHTQRRSTVGRTPLDE